jgi:hypothetical protein
MTVSASRVQYIWSPLLGWALLTCAVPAAMAQVGVPVPGVTVGTVLPTDPTTPPPSGDQTSGDQTQTPQTNVPNAGALLGGISGSPGAVPDVAPATTLPVGVPLPPGTTVQNPSTQIIPGASDVFSGTISGSGVGVGGITGGGPGGEELGITMGSFRLYPAIDISTGYDNNVFAQSNNSTTTTSGTSTTTTTTPTVGSLTAVFAPSLAIRSDWMNHSINFLMGGGFGFYQSAPTQNYQNYFFIADGRIDIRDDWFLAWSLGYRRATEALGTPNVAFAQAPTVAESLPFSLSMVKKFNRFSIEVGGSAIKSWFTDYSTITSAGLPAEDRNRWDYEEHFRLGYDLSEDVTVFFGPSIQQSRYALVPDSFGQNRNSNGAGISFGARWAIGPTSAIEGSVGYTQQDQGSLGSTSAYTFALVGTWNGYQPLTIRPNLSRGITATALTNYRSTVTTVLGVDYNYRLFDEWAVAGGTSYSISDYQPIDGLGASPREDTFFRSSIGLLWQPRPQLSIGPVFEYAQGASTDPINGPQYSRQIISIRLTARR